MTAAPPHLGGREPGDPPGFVGSRPASHGIEVLQRTQAGAAAAGEAHGDQRGDHRLYSCAQPTYSVDPAGCLI